MPIPIDTDTNVSTTAQDRLWAARPARETRSAQYHARARQKRNIPAALLRSALRVTGLYARGLENAGRIHLNRLRLVYRDLPDGLVGFTILHLSDLHLRRETPLDRLCSVLSRIECDVCAMTGDYAYSARRTHEYLTESMQQVVGAIRSRHGVYGVLGNHDHAADVDRLKSAGVQMLINDGCAMVSGGATIWLAGVDDPHDFRTHDLERAFGGAPQKAFRILLAHSPELADDANRLDARLYLCGHTHGGQVCTPWGPLFLNIRCRRRYGWGVWRHESMWGVTTTGLGATAVPVRYCCPPEVTLIELAKQ